MIAKNTLRTLFCLTTVLGLSVGAANAGTLSVVAEESGNTWSAMLDGAPVTVGLLGVTDGENGVVHSLTDIENSVASGSLRGVFNGLSFTDAPSERAFATGAGIDVQTSPSPSPFPQQAYDGTLDETVASASTYDAFSSVELGDPLDASRSGRYFGLALVAFDSPNLVFDGTSTFNAGGTLGDLGELSGRVVPSPSAGLAGAALLVTTLVRRRRSASTRSA